MCCDLLPSLVSLLTGCLGKSLRAVAVAVPFWKLHLLLGPSALQRPSCYDHSEPGLDSAAPACPGTLMPAPLCQPALTVVLILGPSFQHNHQLEFSLCFVFLAVAPNLEVLCPLPTQGTPALAPSVTRTLQWLIDVRQVNRMKRGKDSSRAWTVIHVGYFVRSSKSNITEKEICFLAMKF